MLRSLELAVLVEHTVWEVLNDSFETQRYISPETWSAENISTRLSEVLQVRCSYFHISFNEQLCMRGLVFLVPISFNSVGVSLYICLGWPCTAIENAWWFINTEPSAYLSRSSATLKHLHVPRCTCSSSILLTTASAVMRTAWGQLRFERNRSWSLSRRVRVYGIQSTQSE